MIRCKSGRVYTEWRSDRLSPRAVMAVLYYFHLLDKHGKDAYITHIFRTAEEQVAIIAKQGTAGGVYSLHQAWRAVDVGIRGIPDEVVNEAVDKLNRRVVYRKGDRHKTAIRHDSGFGDHVHIQAAEW